jgi:hypothetical protein
MNHYRHVVFTGFVLLAGLFQPPAQNREFEALQAHFERIVTARSDALFSGIGSVAQWEERKQSTRLALARMLWHDRRWPEGAPSVAITRRQEYPQYVVENIVLETAPKIYSTANLYLPRSAVRPFPVILYQCGHANKDKFTRHGAWFAAKGIAVMIMDNIEMGEIEFTHHGVYSLVPLVQPGVFSAGDRAAECQARSGLPQLQGRY